MNVTFHESGCECDLTEQEPIEIDYQSRLLLLYSVVFSQHGYVWR